MTTEAGRRPERMPYHVDHDAVGSTRDECPLCRLDRARRARAARIHRAARERRGLHMLVDELRGRLEENDAH